MNIVGIVLGFISLSQIKRTGEKGRGLAIAGIIIGFVIMICSIILTIVMFAIASKAAESAASYESSRAAYSASASALAADEASVAAEEASAAAADVEAEAIATLDPASPYCLAIEDFLNASETVQQDANADAYIASLTNLRDNAPNDEMRASLTTAIDAFNSQDAEVFESALTEVAWDLGLDAVKCGIA